MDFLEVSAKTVDEATAQALQKMGVSRDDVKITVLSEGKSGGFFGIGAEDAKVRIERLAPEAAPVPVAEPGNEAPVMPNAEVARVAAETLDKLVKLLEVDGTVVAGEYPGENGGQGTAEIAFNVEGEDLGILIGRRGQTLAALQYVLRLIVGHQTNAWVPIIVDAEGYKERRRDALRALALRMADHVKQRGAPFTLEPMPPYERRIIHITLADNPAVFTESIGEDEARKVVIRPKNPGVRQPGNEERSGNRYQPGNSFAPRPGYAGGQRPPSGGQRSGGGYGGGQRSGGYGGQRSNYNRPRRDSPPPY